MGSFGQVNMLQLYQVGLDFLRNLCNADIMVAFVGRGANSAKKLI
jgi:hypothetical protein